MLVQPQSALKGWKRLAGSLGLSIGTAALCLLAGVAILAMLGYPAESVLNVVGDKVLWRSDPELRLEAWRLVLQYSTPILLTGLAITIAFRASVWNIGAQGQFLLGAVAANAAGAWLNWPAALTITIVLLAGMSAGAAWACIAASLEWRRRVPIVLSTLLLNAVALLLLKWAIQGPLRHPDPVLSGRSREMLPQSWLPPITDLHIHAGFFIAVAGAAGVAFLINWTTLGFRLRMVGENATAARFAGVNVPLTALLTMAMSGALAGLAGGIEVCGVRHELSFADGESAFGFTGIAVALLGGLRPTGVIVSAIFFGALNRSFQVLQSELQVPFVTGQAVQGLIVILMLVVGAVAARRRVAGGPDA